VQYSKKGEFRVADPASAKSDTQEVH
jgi:hypothetical protein